MPTDVSHKSVPPLSGVSTTISKAQPLSLPAILRSLLGTSQNVSDVIFSPGRLPQVELAGRLVQGRLPGLVPLTSDDTQRIAAQVMGTNTRARQTLETEGACDVSYGVDGLSRFRVNIFKQRGSYAIVMRIIPSSIPTFEELGLPPQLADVMELKNGIVLVTGPAGAGKSSTLAAFIGRINEEKAYHIVTIEDPIEFLHGHNQSTIHQREVHSDTPTFALALRAALRQAPNVILVGEMRDRETTEIALEAAETGHLVLSSLHTIDASKTVERITGVFPLEDQHLVRLRFSKAFRYVISQRLIEVKDGTSRVAAFEILKSTVRTREYIQKGESDGRSLLDAMRDGDLDGMQHFDAEIEKLIRARKISVDAGLTYATNPGNLRLQLGDFVEETGTASSSGPFNA
ncbi:MAG TPA: PilT/PilU family type 4a pilus ATPase [Terriglobia bacterium]|nr:PilT/PilU family type 4a pilus ATPase [Terriglobia bacterium]